jgi:hypothetical protein
VALPIENFLGNGESFNQIKEKYKNGKYTQRQLSIEYRISPNKISQILNNKI